MSLTVQEIPLEKKEESVILMTNFFSIDDVVWKYSVEDFSKRGSLIREYFVGKWSSYVFKYGHIFGVREGNEQKLSGITIVFSPKDKLDISLTEVLKNAFESPLKLGLGVFNKYFKAVKRINSTAKKFMQKKPHWRIMHPSPCHYFDHICEALLKYIIRESETDKYPIYHEVFSAAAAKKLENFGFELLGEYSISSSEDAPKFWALVRYPKEGTESLKLASKTNEGLSVSTTYESSASEFSESTFKGPIGSYGNVPDHAFYSQEKEDETDKLSKSSPVKTPLTSSSLHKKSLSNSTGSPTQSQLGRQRSSFSVKDKHDGFALSLSSVQNSLQKKNAWEIDYSEVEVLEIISPHDYTPIYKAKWREQIVAFKCWLPKPDPFLKDAEIIVSLKPHKNLIAIYGVCVNTENPIGLVMEYIPTGNLKKYLETHVLNLSQKLTIAKHVALGVKSLHSDRRFHRNLTAEHVLITEGKRGIFAQISPFSSGRLIDLKNESIWHLPPETLTNRVFNFDTDAWMFGCLLSEIFSNGSPVYANHSPNQVVSLVSNKQLRPAAPTGCLEEISTLIKICCAFDPDERPDFRQICEGLESIKY